MAAFFCLLFAIFALGHTSYAFVRSPPAQRQFATSLILSESSKNTEAIKKNEELDEKQQDFCLGYLNKHHKGLLKKFSEAFSPLGAEMAKANAWSGGSFKIQDAWATAINGDELELGVSISRRGQGDSTETVKVSWNANVIPERQRYYKELDLVPDDPNRLLIDDVARRLNRLSWIVDEPKATGKFLQLAIQLGGVGIGKLPENMYLNQVPHNRYVRQYFYDQAAAAVLEAVIRCSDHKQSNRMKVISQFPEMNPSMDSYRIGTILEMARAIALRLAEENLRVRVCVQGSMGVGIFTGVPKQLNGVSKLLQMMDWGQDHIVGEWINFGAVGREHVQNEEKDDSGTIVRYQDDVFILIAPQSMVGTDSSIIPALQEMVDAAGDRPVCLLNPDLSDKVSSQGQQSVRGRQQRIDFAASFQTVYHFQNIYVSGTSYFPILGAITKMRPSEPWCAHQRLDYAQGDGEIYMPVLSGETMPTGEDILAAFEK